MVEGYYYLHTNGDLIYKRMFDDTYEDLMDSDFVVSFWPIDPSYRGDAWNLLIEALASGANKGRVMELANKWHCTNGDAERYSKAYEVNLLMDGEVYCATKKDFVNFQESDAGFGNSYLEALADLCKNLGYRPGKGWGKMSFEKLLECKKEEE